MHFHVRKESPRVNVRVKGLARGHVDTSTCATRFSLLPAGCAPCRAPMGHIGQHDLNLKGAPRGPSKFRCGLKEKNTSGLGAEDTEAGGEGLASCPVKQVSPQRPPAGLQGCRAAGRGWGDEEKWPTPCMPAFCHPVSGASRWFTFPSTPDYSG